jgi:glutathione S-transferase
MKLYCHPASSTSRGLMLFAAQAPLPLDLQTVERFGGEHRQDAFAAINSNRLVPVLVDGPFRLTESSAILKHLADQAASPLYPREPRTRARVNERIDWVNTQLKRDLATGPVGQRCAVDRRPVRRALRRAGRAGGQRPRGLSARARVAVANEGAAELAPGVRSDRRLCRDARPRVDGQGLTTVMMKPHHIADRCRATETLHTFHRLADGSFVALFDCAQRDGHDASMDASLSGARAKLARWSATRALIAA